MQAFTTHSAEETRNLGKRLACSFFPSTLVALAGDLGAGKTTLIQGVLEGMGAERPFVSPTFVLMKQYDLREPVNGIQRIYHADAYRVGEKDFAQLGFNEWITDPEGLVLLEWPERLGSLVPTKHIQIELVTKGEGEREVRIKEKN